MKVKEAFRRAVRTAGQGMSLALGVFFYALRDHGSFAGTKSDFVVLGFGLLAALGVGASSFLHNLAEDNTRLPVVLKDPPPSE